MPYIFAVKQGAKIVGWEVGMSRRKIALFYDKEFANQYYQTLVAAQAEHIRLGNGG